MAVMEYDKSIPNQTEEKTGAQTVINSDHRMTHMKGMFTAIALDAALADNGFLRMGITVPADLEIHLKNVNLWGVGVPFQMKFYRFPTFTHATAITPINHYIKASGVPASLITCSKNPTGISSSGNDMILLFGGGTGVGGTSSGGVYSPTAEFILNEGDFIIEIQNLTGGVAETQMILTWYELQES